MADKDSPGVVIKRFINKNLSLLQISGWLILFALWYLVTNFGLINTHILPTPQKTWNSFLEMKKDDNLWDNILFSVRINLIVCQMYSCGTGSWLCHWSFSQSA